MNFIFGILIAFLSAWGFVVLLYCLAEYLLFQSDAPSFLLVPVSQADEDLEIHIKQAKLQLKHLHGKGARYIIILDNGMSEWMREIACKEAEGNDYIFLCRADELQKFTRYSKM